MRVSILVFLSVKLYICLSRDPNPLPHDPEALSGTKHVNQTSSSGLYDEKEHYNEHILCVVFIVCLGLTSLSTYHDGVWLVATASSMLTFIVLRTEVSCPRHLTRNHIQSHYPDTASTSPSSSP